MLAVQHIIPNVRSFVNATATLGFWVYSSKNTKGYVRVLRQYNMTQKGATPLQPIFIQSFDTLVGTWKYITMSIPFGALDVSKTIVDNEDGVVIQIGPCYYRWSFSVITGTFSKTEFGSTEPFTSTTPGVEFVLAEIQFRTDTPSLSGGSFPTNLREEERTLKYTSYIATQKPQTRIYAPNSPIVLNTGSARYTPAGPAEVETNYYLPLSSRMITRPKMIYWGAQQSSTGGVITINWTSGGGGSFNSGSTRPDMWGTVSTPSLDVNAFLLSLRVTDAGLPVFCNLHSANFNAAFPVTINISKSMRISSITESGIVFTGVIDLDDMSPGTYYNEIVQRGVPVDIHLVVNRSTDWGYFTAIVPECDMGLYSNQTEILSSVDTNNTAPTSLPFQS
jgi:hypothetical protein